MSTTDVYTSIQCVIEHAGIVSVVDAIDAIQFYPSLDALVVVPRAFSMLTASSSSSSSFGINSSKPKPETNRRKTASVIQSSAKDIKFID